MIRVEETREEDLRINLAPMIDMVFLLIIFFLTATTFTQKEREQDVLLPSTRGAGSLSRQLERNVIVNVKKDGGIYVAGRRCDEGRLQALVADRNVRVEGTLKVKVRADKRAPYGYVARALAAIERAGVRRPYIDTREEILEP
jgi:biopolymer transport protein ExbD